MVSGIYIAASSNGLIRTRRNEKIVQDPLATACVF